MPVTAARPGTGGAPRYTLSRGLRATAARPRARQTDRTGAAARDSLTGPARAAAEGYAERPGTQRAAGQPGVLSREITCA
jgi:hypothetical protein